MKNAAFDRVTGCESLESSERQARERDAAPWPWVYLDAWGKRYRVLGAELWDREPKVWRIDGDGLEAVQSHVPDSRAALVVEALRERELDERRALENEQTDARAIDWLKKRERLVEQEDGRWVLV